MSVSRHHADWLSLVESSGPFLSLPVLLRAFPQGLDPRDPEQAKQLRLAYEEWQENPSLTAKQRAWVMHVLTQVLLHPKELLAEGQTLPPGLTATMAEYGEILRPELALVGPMGSEMAGKPQLLISLYPEDQSLDKPVIGKHWKATPGTRMMELLHATDVPLGLVTNGEEWMLVFAPRGDTTGFTSLYASLWTDTQDHRTRCFRRNCPLCAGRTPCAELIGHRSFLDSWPVIQFSKERPLAAGIGFRYWRLRCFRPDTSQMAVTALRARISQVPNEGFLRPLAQSPENSPQ